MVGWMGRSCTYLVTRYQLRVCVLASHILPPKSSQVFRLETKFLFRYRSLVSANMQYMSEPAGDSLTLLG